MADGFTGPPAVDFYSMLSGLGDTIKAQRVSNARKEAFSNFSSLDPSSPDYGREALGVAQKLGSAGDQEGALRFLTLAQGASDKAAVAARDARDFAFRQDEARRAQSNADRTFNKDKYTIKEVENPDGSKTLVRVNTDGTEGPINTGAAPQGQPNNPFSPGKFNADQGKAAGFTDRMLQSEGILSGVAPASGQEGPTSPGVQNVGSNVTQTGLSNIPGVGNFLISGDRQKYNQAKADFINAQLRRESGAAIAASEFASADKQYFPVPGDSAEVIKQKAANRRAAIEAMGREGGQSYRPKFTFGQDGSLVPYEPKASGPAKAVSAPAGAIAALKKDPRLAAQFDAKYGKGAAKSALGGEED